MKNYRVTMRPCRAPSGHAIQGRSEYFATGIEAAEQYKVWGEKYGKTIGMGTIFHAPTNQRFYVNAWGVIAE